MMLYLVAGCDAVCKYLLVIIVGATAPSRFNVLSGCLDVIFLFACTGVIVNKLQAERNEFPGQRTFQQDTLTSRRTAPPILSALTQKEGEEKG